MSQKLAKRKRVFQRLKQRELDERVRAKRAKQDPDEVGAVAANGSGWSVKLYDQRKGKKKTELFGVRLVATRRDDRQPKVVEVSAANREFAWNDLLTKLNGLGVPSAS